MPPLGGGLDVCTTGQVCIPGLRAQHVAVDRSTHGCCMRSPLPRVCPCVWVRVAGFFLASMGRMKSASWTELGSASFLGLGLMPPSQEREQPLSGLGRCWAGAAASHSSPACAECGLPDTCDSRCVLWVTDTSPSQALVSSFSKGGHHE